MLYLLLNVVFASTFMLTIKWVQNRRREDILTVGAINYIVAAVWIAPTYFATAPQADSAAVFTGVAMGACYFLAFFVVIRTVEWMGAASSTVIGVTSILLPIFCGVVIWAERPSQLQGVGVVLALAALALVGWSRDPQESSRSRPWYASLVVVLFFILAGVARLAQEAFKHTSEVDQRSTYLFAAFVVAGVPSLAILLARRRSVTLTEFGFGFLMGAANILQTDFILKSLEHFDGFIVFPATSAGGLILTTVVATRLLGEQLTRRTYAGIGIAVAALVLLNWTPS